MGVLNAPSEGRKQVLELLRSDASLRCELVKADFTNDDSLTYAGLTLADFSGYTYLVPSFDASIINGSGDGESAAGDLTWEHDGGGTNNTIYGVVISSEWVDATRRLLLACKFDTPVSMASLGATIVRSFNMLMGNFAA